MTKANPPAAPAPDAPALGTVGAPASDAPALDTKLGNLIRLLYAEVTELGQFMKCDKSQAPASYQPLLAHDAHMTVTVEQRHGCPVSVEVLESQESETHYVRKILLRRTSDNRVVQYGIVRLKLDAIDAEARAEILAKQTPLGRVLIQHNVMRHVELLDVWRVHCGEELGSYFGVRPGHETFGRTALIYCNDEPAIELLEIVAPEDTF